MKKLLRAGALLVVVSTLAGCGTYMKGAIRTASLDHQCPREQITVVESVRETAVLQVCGQRRVYRDIGGASAIVWTDVTRTAGN